MKERQRKSYTTEFKVKAALEAIKGQRTINEIATHYGLHPNGTEPAKNLSPPI